MIIDTIVCRTTYQTLHFVSLQLDPEDAVRVLIIAD